jgi:SAM-dependent methyltransferase
MKVKPIDYLELWRTITERHNAVKQLSSHKDIWKHKAEGFDTNVKKRWKTPDFTREWLRKLLESNPDSSFLDIGAGTGAWSCFAAPLCKYVTALEPSQSMISILSDNIQNHDLKNVHIIKQAWPAKLQDTHDITLSAHSLYGCSDFASCIKEMNDITNYTCILLLRAPLTHGLTAEISRKIWGHPHDSPNFQIAYNALLQMGILADVVIENNTLWRPWEYDSFESAFCDIKKKMGIPDTTRYDSWLMQILRKKLVKSNNHYLWPDTVRSALVYWQPRFR